MQNPTQLDLGQILQNILNGLGGLGNVIQNLFPQIQGLSPAIASVIYGVNAMTNNSISNVANQVNVVGSNILNSVNNVVNNATRTLSTMLQTGVSQVQNTVNSLNGNLFQQFSQITNVIGNSINGVNAILAEGYRETIKNSNTLDLIVKNLTAGQDPNITIRELNFWEQLQRLPDILITLFRDLPSGLADNFMKKNIGVGLDFGHTIDEQWQKMRIVIENFTRGKYKTYQEAINDMENIGLHAGWVMFAMNISTIALMVGKLAVSKSQPIFEVIDQLSWQDNPTKLLDLNTYKTLMDKNTIQLSQFIEYAKRLGFSSEQAYLFAEADKKLPDINSLVTYFLRGKINTPEFEYVLKEMDFSVDAIEMLKEAIRVIPSPNDLTRIADKRIWGLNLPEKYGQYAELPQQYIDYMKQSGYDQQFTKWFWAAHWELPSPNQIFEMYQRHVINQEDMQAYLALTDWLPFFRDKLLAISYNPLTRVDIRRMYALGMFTPQELVTRYEAIGFSPADSQLMANFTIKFNGDDEAKELEALKNKIANQVEALYVRGKLTRNEALNRLVALGKDRQFAELVLNFLTFEQYANSTKPKLETYKNKAINLLIAQYLKGHYSKENTFQGLIQAGLSESEANEEIRFAEIERQALYTQDLINTYETRFINGLDSQSQFVSKLSQLGLNAGEIGQAIVEADMKLQKRFKMPTEKQIQTWYAAEVITIDDVIKYLNALGYPPDMIPVILKGDYDYGV